LEAEGYTAFHPQKHTFEEQIAAYKAATHIISIDGSPLHMAVKAFQDIETTTISALVQNWIPETDNRPSRVSFGEVDFGVIYDQLKEGGFISGADYANLIGSQPPGYMPARRCAFRQKARV